LPRTDVDSFVAVPWEETLALIDRARSRSIRLEALTESQQHAARADVAEACALEVTAAFHEQQTGRMNYALTQDDVDALVLEARWRRYMAEDSHWSDDPDNRLAIPFEGDAHAPQDIKARLAARPTRPRRDRGELPADAQRLSWSWTAWVSSFLAERRRVVGLDQLGLLPIEVPPDDLEQLQRERHEARAREPGDDNEDAVGWAGEGAAPA
jgi:hypothetical protein